MALTEPVPASARPVDARLPENDPFRKWDKFTHARAVLRPQRLARMQALREALPKRLKVG